MFNPKEGREYAVHRCFDLMIANWARKSEASRCLRWCTRTGWRRDENVDGQKLHRQLHDHSDYVRRLRSWASWSVLDEGHRWVLGGYLTISPK